MQTLSEFLKNKENQEVARNRIISCLRNDGEWGRHGIFAKIGKVAGLSPAYVGQVFNSKRPLTENFVHALAEDYFKVPVEWLGGRGDESYEEVRADLERADKLGSAMVDYVAGQTALVESAKGVIDRLDNGGKIEVVAYAQGLIDREGEELAGRLKAELEERTKQTEGHRQFDADLNARVAELEKQGVVFGEPRQASRPSTKKKPDTP